ncbi:MAG: hypothetical protein ACYDGO_05800 [Smithellaceae bacterium]
MNIDEKTYFDLKKSIEQYSAESFEFIQQEISKDESISYITIQILRAIRKPFAFLEYESLINYLLQIEKLTTEVFRTVFSKENLINYENVIVFNQIIQGNVYKNILKCDDKSNVYEAIKFALESCKNDDRRFIFIDDENLSMLKDINTYSDLFTPILMDKLYTINASSKEDYLSVIRKINKDVNNRTLYELWIMSFICRENLHNISMGILYSEYESRKSNISEEDDKPFTYYAEYTTKLLKGLYDCFREINNYDKLDEIVSFCFLYFSLGSDTYSRKYLIAANDDIYYILIEFLMSNPEVNLDLLVNEHKKNKYKDAWEYTVPYNGTESVGSGLSRSGNVFTLHDSPIVEKILSPFFMRLYEENGEKPQNKNLFIKIINGKIFRNLQTSASNPIYLKRAAIPSLLIGLLTLAPGKKKAFKQRLLSVVDSAEGLPRCSEVVFHYLMQLNHYLDKYPQNYDHVYDLIIQDIKLSGNGLPSNVFTVQAILMLIKKKHKKTKKIFIKLLENPEYIKLDDWNYHTLANLTNDNEFESDFILKVIKVFINNEVWLTTGREWNVHEVIPYLVWLYLKGNKETQEVHKEIIKLANAETKTESNNNLCTYFLGSLAEKDPEKAYLIFKEILGNKKLWDVFPYRRDSLVSIVEHIIAKVANVNDDNVKKSLLDSAIELIEIFIDDPDPSTDNNGPGYNYHTQIINNEGSGIITTVRGHLCWAVQKLCVHDYTLERAWKYTNKLLQDKNLYVVYQALVPFIEIVKRRNKLPEKDKISIEKAIEYCVENYSQYKSLANHLGLVCSYYRDINEAMAAKFIEKLAGSENFGFFIVYFAYFREDQYPEKGTFNSLKFKSQIIDLIQKNTEQEAIKKIFNQLGRIIDDNTDFLPRIIDPLNAYIHNTAIDNSILHIVYRIVSKVLETDKNKKYYYIILDIYRRFLKIEKEFIESSLKLNEAKRFLMDYSHRKILETLSEISKDDYYAFTSEIMTVALSNNLYIDHFSFAKTLASECDPVFIPKAINLLNKMTILNPKYYEFKSQLESLL